MKANVFRLTQEVHFEHPRAWPACALADRSVQARHVFVYRHGKPFTAEVDRLVIYLGPRRFFDGQENREGHLYRFSDGRVGVLDTSPDGCFTPVEDPEVIALAGLVKTLPELMAEKGLSLDAISRIDPFTLIVCPMCGGTEFTTLDFAGVWCDRCSTRFETRMTSGDPGVVVDAFLEHYIQDQARIVAPRSLMLTLILKDFGYSSHPEGRCGDNCVNGTHISAPTSLRDSSRWCGLQVYDWSLYGWPRQNENDRWLVRRFIGEDIPDGAEKVIYARDSVRSERLPSLELRADGEKWCLVDCLATKPAGLPWYPVWWKVVTDEETRMTWGITSTHKVWQVVDRTLCPVCLQPADDDHDEWCRKQWNEMGWEPGWAPQTEVER